MNAKTYFKNIGTWATQTLNVWSGGDPDQSLSGRTGIAFLLNKTWAVKLGRPLLDYVFFKLRNETNHCVNSIEWDRVKPEIKEKLKNALKSI